MAHVVTVVSEATDPRPFVQPADTELRWQARCDHDGCSWKGAQHDTEHAAVQEAKEHEDQT